MMEDVNGLNEASQTLHDSANSPGHPLIACPTTGCQTGYNTYSVIINRTNTSAETLEYVMDGVVEDTITEASVGTAAGRRRSTTASSSSSTWPWAVTTRTASATAPPRRPPPRPARP